MRLRIASKTAQGRSKNLTAERLINLYPETAPAGASSEFELRNTPGLVLDRTLGVGPIRGIGKHKGQYYAVSGSELYRFDGLRLSDGFSGSGPVQFESNGNEMLICETSTNRLSYTTGTDFARLSETASSITYMDGYFICTRPNSGQFFISRLYSVQFDALDFASAETKTDNAVRVLADHRELWVFGEDTAEIWVNQGTTDFPFGRVDGAINEKGCSAPFSAVQIDNSVIWLDKDGIVRRADGYTPLRISTHAIETAIREGNVAGATAFSYVQEGHEFYCLTVPASGTFVFDAATGQWHERKSFELPTWRVSCASQAGLDWYAGDDVNGNIYRLDVTSYQENGEFLIGEMIFPPITNDGARFRLYNLELDLDTGLGASNAMLSTSRDGLNWSSEQWRSLGAEGERLTRPQWKRLGQYRDCHIKIGVSGNIRKGAFAAYAEIG